MFIVGYHEVPDEDNSRITPAFQITDRSETTDKVIPPNPNPSNKPDLPLPNESHQRLNDSTTTEDSLFRQTMDYLNVDFKFLTTIVLLLCTIGAVVVYFPRVCSFLSVHLIISSNNDQFCCCLRTFCERHLLCLQEDCEGTFADDV